MDFKKYIDTVENFPSEGISFKDITSMFRHPDVVKQAIIEMANNSQDLEFEAILGADSRGIWFTIPIAIHLNKKAIFARKAGKLPKPSVKASYGLEYGKDAMEIQKEDITKGMKILVVDDVLATGGTISAISKIIQELGGQIVGFNFLIELKELKGREKLSAIAPVVSLIKY
jgi:adenine phosphoribosyltransferase